jgi:hypothetical protein
MTTAQIIESVKAIRNQIAIIQNQVENDSTIVQEGTLDAALWDAQEALANVLTMIEPNPYK